MDGITPKCYKIKESLSENVFKNFFCGCLQIRKSAILQRIEHDFGFIRKGILNKFNYCWRDFFVNYFFAFKKPRDLLVYLMPYHPLGFFHFIPIKIALCRIVYVELLLYGI